MHHRVQHRRWLAALLAALFIGTLDTGVGQDLGAFDTLTLILTGPSSRVLLLEPVPLTMALENRTTRGVPGHTYLDFGDQQVQVEVTPRDGKPYFVEHLSAVLSLTRGRRARVISPGESIQHTDVLLMGLDRVFPSPGDYRLRVLLSGIERGEGIWSNNVTVSVEAPEGLELEAYEYIRELKRAANFFVTFGVPDDEFEQLERFANLFDSTPYGPWAAYQIVSVLSAREQVEAARPYLPRVSERVVFQRWPSSARVLREAALAK